MSVQPCHPSLPCSRFLVQLLPMLGLGEEVCRIGRFQSRLTALGKPQHNPPVATLFPPLSILRPRRCKTERRGMEFHYPQDAACLTKMWATVSTQSWIRFCEYFRTASVRRTEKRVSIVQCPDLRCERFLRSYPSGISSACSGGWPAPRRRTINNSSSSTVNTARYGSPCCVLKSI